MKNITTMYYIDNSKLVVKNLEHKYLPFIREKLLMKDIRKRVFSRDDEFLLREIKSSSRAFWLNKMLWLSARKNVN